MITILALVVFLVCQSALNYYGTVVIAMLICFIAPYLSNEIRWFAVGFSGSIGLAITLYYFKKISLGILSGNFRFSSTEWLSRIAYYTGAVKHIIDYPLFGSGGQGWAILSEQYAGIYVKFVHCYYLQLMVDVGILGLVTFILFLVFVAQSFMEAEKKNWSAFLIIISLLAHSLIDVDMQFQLIAFILFYYCGVLIEDTKAKNFLDNKLSN